MESILGSKCTWYGNVTFISLVSLHVCFFNLQLSLAADLTSCYTLLSCLLFSELNIFTDLLIPSKRVLHFPCMFNSASHLFETVI